MDNSLLIIGIIIGCVVGFLIAKLFFIGEKSKDRQLSIKSSKATILGHVKEQVAPLLPNFPYHTKDMIFIGKGFDYLVLDGLSEGDLRRIVFLEVKTGSSVQNKNEKQIERIIGNKFISYELFRL